jgi:YVTN family beta-propeller protein
MPGAVVSYGSSASSVIEILPGNFVHSVGPLGAATVTATYANSFAQVTDSLPVTVNQYAVPTGTIIDSFPTGTATYGVAVSKAVSYVSVPDPSGPVRRFDLPARQFGSVVPGVGAGLGVAFDPSGSQAYVATLQDGLAVINPTTNAIDSHIGYPMVGSQRDVIVSPDGLRLYVATAHVRIYIINTATRQVIDSIPVPGLPNHFSWHPAGSRLYASLDNGQVAEIDVSAGQVTRLFPTGSASQGTAVAPDGSELYNVTENNELFVVDLATGNQVANVVGLGGFGLVATPDGSRLYVAGGPNVKIVDRLSRTLIDSIVVGGGARRIALSRDGGTAFVANQAGWVNVIY